ncbi:MAG: tryptophan halogenase [Hyphomonadaceae bacterium]|nr:MAG: tryptophan halogenase [Hyphomonadaceae bacterium]KAF0182989.1 MAG: tryptophan halogenase [Hyphomonadaceae bacterium]
MQNNKIKKIVIVGGGTAGWMSAALLSKFFAQHYEIILVESEEIGIIGVGEATIPAIKNFNNLLGIDDAEMMKATQGTYKLGIEFVNWRKLSHSYIHGFGRIGQDRLWLRTHQFWLKMNELGKAKDYDKYSINVVAARANKFAHANWDNPNSPMKDIDHAYHFDATLYSKFLRKDAEARGVKRIEGRIEHVTQNPQTGFISKLTMRSGEEIEGDLFVDCSGLHGLLLDKTLGIGYDDWSHWLVCDRALALGCENAPVLNPYTKSIAREAGWQWRIPLQHRIGNGIVYSSQFTTDENAKTVLLNNLDGAPIGEPRLVKFTPGKRKKTFEKNVVAIGLSSGFLEPLESTSIHLIQSAILRLVALFPSGDFNQIDIDEYNRQTDFEYENVRDFIISHYKITERDDAPMWQYTKNMDIPDSLRARIELFKSSARFFKKGDEVFLEESWSQVLLGQGLSAKPDPSVDLISQTEAQELLDDIQEVIADCVDKMPNHAEFIAKYCKA